MIKKAKYATKINNSNAAEVQRLNTRVDELLRERDVLRKALTDILDANNNPYLIARKALGARP